MFSFFMRQVTLHAIVGLLALARIIHGNAFAPLSHGPLNPDLIQVQLGLAR